MEPAMNLIVRMALCAALACSLPVLAQPAGGRAASTQEGPIMMQLPHRLQPLFNHTKPVCFTRFIIDVPASATVVYGRMTVDTEVSRYAGQAGELDQKIDKLIGQISRGEGAFSPMDAHTPERVGKRLPGKMPGLTHVMGWYGQEEYSLHSFLVMNDDIFLMEGLGIFEKNLQRKFNMHEEVARQLRARNDDEIPADDGICIDGATADRRPVYENIQIGIRLAEFPDVHFSIETMKNREYVKPDQEFLDRLTSAEKTAHEEGRGKFYDRIKFFSRAPRTVLEWRGHQVLARVPALPGGHERHEFIFYSGGEVNDPFHPEIDIELDTGVKENKKGSTPPSLTDAEVQALWDKLLGSIRVRQVAPPAAVKPAVTLGMTVDTTQSCPQAGWWECLDADRYGGVAEVVGGRMRYFHAGVAMPQAALQPSSKWQRMLEGKPAFRLQQPSQWRLADRRRTARSLQPAVAHVGNDSGNGTVSDSGERETALAPGAKCACGSPCPASGWWGNADVKAAEPARWFGQGEIMPDIRYRLDLNWWQRLVGAPQIVARKTAWQFLRAEVRNRTPTPVDVAPTGEF
jgi:hypothetical protein